MIDGDVTLLFVSQECDTSSIQPIQPIVQPEVHHHHYVPQPIPQPPPIIIGNPCLTNPHVGINNYSTGYYPQPPIVLGVRHPYSHGHHYPHGHHSPHGHHFRHHFRRRFF